MACKIIDKHFRKCKGKAEINQFRGRRIPQNPKVKCHPKYLAMLEQACNGRGMAVGMRDRAALFDQPFY